MMIVASARQLAGERVCFVGVGPPNIACNLAKRTVAPDIELLYEAGVFGAEPARLPLSIGDPTLVTGSLQVTNMYELFAYFLERGHVDVGFLGGARPKEWQGQGPTVVVTGLGVYRFDAGGEMTLESLHPGVTLEKVRENTSWDLKVPAEIRETAPPTDQELRLIREELDPEGRYTR